MGRNREPIIVSSVIFDYVGTDEQFNIFLKSIIKDYITENRLLPEEENNIKKL